MEATKGPYRKPSCWYCRREGWTAQRNVTITMKDESSQNTVMRWTLQNTVPTKYTGPSLNAKGGSDVAMEELVLSAEGITYSEG